jgi:hypothetical protein
VEERGTNMEVHAEDVEEGARWRQTRRRSGRRRVWRGYDRVRISGLGTLKKKNSSNGYDDIINVCSYI